MSRGKNVMGLREPYSIVYCFIGFGARRELQTLCRGERREKRLPTSISSIIHTEAKARKLIRVYLSRYTLTPEEKG